MSCLRIKFPTAKRAWKSFTSKLKTRLNKSRTIKKPDDKHLQMAVLKVRPSSFLGQCLLRKKQRRALPFGYQHFYVSRNKAAAVPVYVDKLFKEAPLTELVRYIPQPQQPSVKKRKRVADEVAAEAGTTKGREKQGDDMRDGDSRLIGLASAAPMLNGIDARAEEFIVCFRAEMNRQEIIAQNVTLPVLASC
ncbi:hypothetical protein HRI_004575900 [Hibiscus trionum]|uniref:Uncharacterized protein n=1 Tax=Hibiscus trionum TaxID=183268 RepID=A0A9W7J6I9_HIBTR|nr:hypothetical protein HRI_004575900 [Hibiscus trionum]